MIAGVENGRGGNESTPVSAVGSSEMSAVFLDRKLKSKINTRAVSGSGQTSRVRSGRVG